MYSSLNFVISDFPLITETVLVEVACSFANAATASAAAAGAGFAGAACIEVAIDEACAIGAAVGANDAAVACATLDGAVSPAGTVADGGPAVLAGRPPPHNDLNFRNI